MKFPILLSTVILSATAALASGLGLQDLSDDDRKRLGAYQDIRAAAVVEARRHGDPNSVEALDAILAGTPQRILGENMTGQYRCRLAKLDGVLPVIVYGWFLCRIDEDAGGYLLTKTTGSQRTTLRFIDDGESRLVAYGAVHYGHEKPKRYGEAVERDQVGYLVKPEGGRYRIEFPLPRTESRFDILELERR